MALPGPAIALVSSGETIVASCAVAGRPANGFVIGFKSEGEGERLAQSWIKEGSPAPRLLAIPDGRIAAADESGRLTVLDSASGKELWRTENPAGVCDIAYAPGLVLVASSDRLFAYDESSGTGFWSAALGLPARCLSAGSGFAAVVLANGSLQAYSLADGSKACSAGGPFDTALRPVVEGSSILAARWNGALEIDVKTGASLKSWSWKGAATFFVADRERIYVGLGGSQGSILMEGRAGEPSPAIASLEAEAYDDPIVVGGTRGGLLLALKDGALVLVGKDRGRSSGTSVLDLALSPAPEAAASIAAALSRFRPRGGLDSEDYLRFDFFLSGMPVDSAVAFTAFHYKPRSSAKRSFSAEPAMKGEILAIYDANGRELKANIDELGFSPSISSYFEKGSSYWVVAGWDGREDESAPFRLYLR
jgi:FOG: WD40-like repeat